MAQSGVAPAQQCKLAKKLAIEKFGKDDYRRLKNLGMKPRNIRLPAANHKVIAIMLEDMIKEGKLFIMDKESGVPFKASTLTGLQVGDATGLLICNER